MSEYAERMKGRPRSRWLKCATVDDRTRWVRVIPPITASRESGIELDELLQGQRARFWLIFFLVGGFFGLSLAPIFWMVLGHFGIITALVIGGVYGAVLSLYVRRREWRSADAGRIAMLRVGICPSCGFDLSDGAPEPDGCVVCPECESAWRLPA